MKTHSLRISLTCVSLCLVFYNSLIAQSDCKVQIDELAGKYEGECKKGLANGFGTAKGVDQYTGEFKKGLPHGNGVYTYSNGMVYDGEFRNGEKDGEGKMTVAIINNQDSVLTGFWAKDKYVGKYKTPYKIHYKSPLVTNTKITAADGEESIIFLTISLKGKTESNPSIALQEQTGSYSSIQPFGRVTKVYVVRFPFRFTLTYMDETADIEILNKGSWNVSIDINK